ncbi:SDR family oxidoreductase [Sphingomonas sp. 35-24ZXX]|uniref:SDR family oxidoreductase n=1 Tax=Sphingomonas sp. 35-24ZXX TaxID=1545915 RepID=UPI0018CCE84F|nr:SDR family oxidoreductase [Sphingomonas sp. 35-24ZXX]
MAHHLPQTAVVTGAGRGLGAAITHALAASNIQVLGGTPDGPAKPHPLREDDARSASIRAMHCDIRNPDAVEKLWHAGIALMGRIDLWINNAGLALTGADLVDLPPDAFSTMIDINLVGTMNACRVAAKGMQRQGSGAIWNMLGAGWDGKPVHGMNGYATSKAALTFLTAALASEAEGKDYSIGAISPGLVMTEGFFREHAGVPADRRAARDAVVNVIGDHPETIADWIATEMMRPPRNGETLVWLTPDKIAARQAEHPPRDILSRYLGRDRPA